ncbi:hypothetical protein ACKFKG_22065 [Phormidesmis sp. 146-35]
MIQRLKTAMLSCLTVGSFAIALPSPSHAATLASTPSKEVLIAQLPDRVCAGIQTNVFSTPAIYTFEGGIPWPKYLTAPQSGVLLDGPKNAGSIVGMAYLVQLDSGLRGWIPVNFVRQGEC